MEELNVTKEELKEIIQDQYITSGSEASIYQYKKYKALRLYDINKEDTYCIVTGKLIGKPCCEKMIKDLLMYKDNVTLTSFPLGVVKQNGIVIGQIIKFYHNAKTLIEFLQKNEEEDPIYHYLKVLDILQELAENNICYEDVHGGNFLMVNDKIKLVDFSDHKVKVNKHYKGVYYHMFQNFATMVNRINKDYLNLGDIYDTLILPSEIKNDTDNLEDDFDYIRNELLNLKKDKRKAR